MSEYCSSCGSPIPEGQGSSCSMCYGDPSYGRDGYYQEYLDMAYKEEWDRYYKREMENEEYREELRKDTFGERI